MLTASGLGSGLDINALVTQLVASERAISDAQLNRESARFAAKFSALGSLKGALGGFEASLSGLLTASDFQARQASTSSNDDIAVSVTSAATVNTYAVEVSQLAEAHALASSVYADSDTTSVGTGTITIRKGTTDYEVGTDTYNSFTANSGYTPVVITIDSSNDTLDGIAKAINDSSAGINASVINDGSGFRLLMSSDSTGVDESLELVVDDDDSNDTDTSGLSALTFNSAATNLEQTNEALDAQFTINGLAVSNSSNSVTSALDGVTLTLKKVTTGPVEIAVSEDFNAVKAGINSFIAGYNQYIATANSLSSYNVDTEVAGPLLGDFTLRSTSLQIDAIVRGSIANITGSVNNLTDLGITTTSSGTLVLDTATLDDVLATDPDNVAELFAEFLTASDPDISVNNSGTLTQSGTHAVNITQLAGSGSHTGAAVLPDFEGILPPNTLTIDADNDDLTLEIDGLDIGQISLTQGVYTAGEDLAAELQARINESAALVAAGGSVTVTYDSIISNLVIQSATLGSISTVDVLAVDTNTAAELGFAVGDGVAGIDVAGTIGGEAATGAGITLIADSGTAADGLSINIDGGTTGARGDVVITQGFARQLSALLDQILDEESALETRIESFDDQLEDIEDRREDLELRWAALEERYFDQFNALDILLANLNTTSSFLENQLENLNSLANRINNT